MSRNIILFFSTHIYDNQVQKDMMGGACGTHRPEKDSEHFLFIQLKERDNAVRPLRV